MSFHTLSERVNILVQLIIVANKTSPGKAHYCHYFSNCTEEKKSILGLKGQQRKHSLLGLGSTRNFYLPPTCWVWILLGGNTPGQENRSQTYFLIFFKIYCNGKWKHKSCFSLSPPSLQERKNRIGPLSISCNGTKKNSPNFSFMGGRNQVQAYVLISQGLDSWLVCETKHRKAF